MAIEHAPLSVSIAPQPVGGPCDELLVKIAACNTLEAARQWAKESPGDFAGALPLLYALACERHSAPTHGLDSDASTGHWLAALEAIEETSERWLRGSPTKTSSILLTSGRAPHSIIDVELVGDRIYALATAQPDEWSSEGEVSVVLTATLGTSTVFEPLRGRGLPDVYGAGSYLQHPCRLLGLDGDHFLVVGSTPSTNWTAPKPSGGFQIVVYRHEEDGTHALHDLETPTALSGAVEYDLATSSVQVCGASVFAQVRWRDADSARSYEATRGLPGQLGQGFTIVEAIIWSWRTGAIVGRCAFPSAQRSVPIFRLATECCLVSVLTSADGRQEETTWHRVDSPPSSGHSDKVSPGSLDLPHIRTARPYSTALGLKYLDRDQAIDEQLAKALAGNVDRHLARGGLVSPDRFLRPALGAQTPFATDKDLKKARLVLKTDAEHASTLDPIVLALAKLTDLSLSALLDPSQQLSLRVIHGFRAIFSTRPASRSGLLARRQSYGGFHGSRHFLLETSPDIIHSLLASGQTEHVYRIRSTAPQLSANVDPSFAEAVVQRLSTASLSLASPVLMSPAYTPRSYFADVSGIASVAEVAIGDAGWSAILFKPLEDPSMIAALSHEDIYSDGRSIAHFDATADHGRGALRVLTF